MSNWEKIRGYSISMNPDNDMVIIYLYVGGNLVAPKSKEDITKWTSAHAVTGYWESTVEHKVEFAPSFAPTSIDLLRNEKGLVFNPKTKWIHTGRQEAGVGEITEEKHIFTETVSSPT